MRAYVRRSATPGDAVVTDVPDPAPGPGQVLVRVSACGLCGSDLHALNADPGFEFVKEPVVLGHELAGVVEDVGPGVASVRAGDAVVAISLQGCGACRTCRSGATQLCPDRQVLGLNHDGGLAERVVVAERHLVPVPAGLDLRLAAVTEPLSVAVHAVLGRTPVRPGDRVVVSGPGAIGLLCARLAVLSGADVVVLGTDADAALRLPVAATFGARPVTVTSDAAGDAAAAFDGRAADTWIEASGSGRALSAAVSGGVRRAGHLTVVALYAGAVPLVPTDAVRAELTVAASYASSLPDYVRALDLLASGAVDAAALVDEFPLADAQRAVDAAYAAQTLKPLVVMPASRVLADSRDRASR